MTRPLADRYDQRAGRRAKIDVRESSSDGPVSGLKLMACDRRVPDLRRERLEGAVGARTRRIAVESRRNPSTSTSIALPGTSSRARSCASTSSDASSSSATATVVPILTSESASAR